jgi:hypothetical protein
MSHITADSAQPQRRGEHQAIYILYTAQSAVTESKAKCRPLAVARAPLSVTSGQWPVVWSVLSAVSGLSGFYGICGRWPVGRGRGVAVAVSRPPAEAEEAVRRGRRTP